MTFSRPVLGKHSGQRVFVASMFLAIFCCGQLHAQGSGNNGFGLIDGKLGLRLESVSVNTAYSLLPTTASGSGASTWDDHSGVSAAVGWSKLSEHGAISLDYNGGYGRRVRYQGLWDSYNSAHLSYSYSKEIRPHWTYVLGVTAQFTDFNNSFLSPAGTSANSLTTAPPVGTALGPDPGSSGLLQNNAAQSALFGGRILTTNVSNSLAFAKSTRLSYIFSLSLARFQNVGGSSNSSDNQDVNSAEGLLTQSTYGSANLGVSYSMSPRTTMGGNLSISRAVSHVDDSYYTNAQFNLGRAIAPWWQVQVFGGIAFVNSVRQVLPNSKMPQPTGGVGTNFKGHSQTVAFTAAAVVDDAYAIGGSRSLTGNVSWNLHSIGSRWSFFANASEYMTSQSGNGSINSWYGSTGLSRVLNNQLFCGLSASYTSFQGNLLNNLATAAGASYSSAFNNQNYRGVQISLTWTPALKW